MPDYRLCFLNDAGEPASVAEFFAADDESARRLSEDACGGRPAQLWREQVLIEKFSAE
jgi:hypothetical protein